METGSWKLAPSIRYPKAGWRPDEGGGGGNRWVENKGSMSLFNSKARLGAGVHFFLPQQGFHSTWVWDRPPLDQSAHQTQSSPLAWRARRTLRLLPTLLCQPKADFYCPPTPPCRNSRWPPRRPADRTSVSDGNRRRPLFLGLSGPRSLFLSPWRPARDGGKAGHRPGPQRR